LALLLGGTGSGQPPSAPDGKTPPATKTARTDRDGDPLPDGAIARLGAYRLRQGRAVTAVVFSRDGKTVISGATPSEYPGRAEETIRVWDVSTGKRIRQFGQQDWGPSALALSSDGKMLASVANGAPVHLWEPASGKFLGWLGDDDERAWDTSWSLAFSPDGKLLAVCKGGVCIWDVQTGKMVRRLDGVEPPEAVAWSPDGKWLAVGDHLTRLCLFDAATGKQLLRLTDTYSELAFSPDSRSLAAATSDGSAKLWEVPSGKLLQAWETGYLYERRSLAFSPDGSKLAVGGYAEIRVRDVARGKHLRMLTIAAQTATPWRAPVNSLAWSPDGKMLASGGEDGRVRLWDVATGQELFPGQGNDTAPRALAYSPDGRLLASADDGTLRLWDPMTGALLRALPQASTTSLAFSADGKGLIAGSRDGTVRLRDAATGKEISCVKGDAASRSVVLSPDGKVIATIGEHGNITRLWRSDTGKTVWRIEGDGSTNGMAGYIALSPDGNLLAVGGVEQDVTLYDIRTGKETCACERTAGSTCLAFSPDGRTLVSGCDRGAVYFRDVATGKETQPPLEQGGEAPLLGGVLCLCFSPDGRVLATGGRDRTVRLWELATRREIRRFAGHEETVTRLAFAPDGRTLASGGNDQLVLVWDRTGLLERGQLPVRAVDAEALVRLWDRLGDPDPAKAEPAVWALVAAPTQSVLFLAGRLRPVAPERLKQVPRWLADLDSDVFVVRERATRELAELGAAAEDALRQAQKRPPSPEVRQRVSGLPERLQKRVGSPEWLREMRSRLVLEQIGTPEARDVLGAPYRGAP
jgi:WD40 repeat protein